MIELSDLHFEYPDSEFSLHIPQWTIGSGEQAAVIGRSGGGKTTFLHLLAGILTPDTGAVRIEGVDITGFPAEERQDLRALRMGLIFQEFELLEYLTLFDNILLPFRISPVLRLTPEVRQRAGSLAHQVGLGDKLRRFPRHLSHGERQRIAVCRALVTQPALLLSDEPTGNLDVANRDLVMDMLFRYSEQSGAPLLVVTHDPELQERFQRLVLIEDFTSTA